MLQALKNALGLRDVRADIVKWARWGVANTATIHYRETRPMPLAATLPLTTDCSGFVTLCYRLAGAPDPNGLNYNGQGYTGTLLAHGRHITLAEVQPGDVIVYGPGSGWHTALIVEAGPDPLTVSHGQESEPGYVRVSQDGRKPQTYLRFPTTSKEAAGHTPNAPLPAPKPQPTQPPTLSKSDKGPNVKKLQKLLAKNGAAVVVDGDFGPSTLNSLRGFQRRNGLAVDGVAGPKTWAALTKEVAK